MSEVLLLSFCIPLVLTIVMPGLRSLLAAATAVGGVIGWQDYAFWQAANSPDFIGPPALPIGTGALSLSMAGLAIGVLTRVIAHGFHRTKRPLTWPWLILVFVGVSLAVGAAYFAGLIRL